MSVGFGIRFVLLKSRRRAKDLRREVQVLLKRADARLSPEARSRIEAQVVSLDAACQTTSVDQIEDRTKKLETLIGRHLSVYQRTGWLESLESIAYAIVIALMMRALVVEAFKIPSGSMIPTLAIGDQIFVNKFLYGPRMPFTTWRPFHFGHPKRGEVVVFVCPVAPHEDYIKRIIAIAGDEVMVRSGQVTVNGRELTRSLKGPAMEWDRDSTGTSWRAFAARAFEEDDGTHRYVVLEDAEMARHAPDFGPHTVPEGHVFMMGDNRDHSYDSRAWGPVPVDHILGKSMFVWWSWGREGLDWSRLGTWTQ